MGGISRGASSLVRPTPARKPGGGRVLDRGSGAAGVPEAQYEHSSHELQAGLHVEPAGKPGPRLQLSLVLRSGYLCESDSGHSSTTGKAMELRCARKYVDNIFPADAPLRQRWMRLAAGIGFADPRPLHCYYNGGLVGVPAEHAGFLEAWKSLIELAGASGCDLTSMMPGNREMPFHASDQDALEHRCHVFEVSAYHARPAGNGFYRRRSNHVSHRRAEALERLVFAASACRQSAVQRHEILLYAGDVSDSRVLSGRFQRKEVRLHDRGVDRALLQKALSN